MNDLDVYMQLWFIQKFNPYVKQETLTRIAKDMVEDTPYPQREVNGASSSSILASTEPKSYMMCFWLYEKGLSQKTIAELLNISQSAVSQNVNRGEMNARKAPGVRKRYINNYLQQRRNQIREYNLQESRKNSATHNW